jgi:hypothetical protein
MEMSNKHDDRVTDESPPTGERYWETIERLTGEVAMWKQPIDHTGDYVHPVFKELDELRTQLSQAKLEVERLNSLLNTPETGDWFEGAKLEAAHQIERWGADHDVGKTPWDWFWLIGYLSQKAAAAASDGDTDKAKHHTISTAAALLNWHRHLTGENTEMRPGIDPVERGVHDAA